MLWAWVKRIVAMAVLFAVGWISYFTLINVNKQDAVLYKKFERVVFAPAIRAGDLVAVSADNQRIDHLCPLEVAPGDISEAVAAHRYVNGLAQSLPGFTWLVRLFRDGDTEQVGETPDFLLQVAFRGKLISVPAAKQPPISPQCACAVAKAMLRRDKVCVVAQSMVETVLVRSDPSDPDSAMVRSEQTVGLTFRKDAVVLGDLSQLNCPGITNTEPNLPDAQSCAGMNGYDPGVRLRQRLGVIREEKL